MCIQSPETIIKNRERVISFIKEHVKHYASERIVDYRDEPVYLKLHDYDVRNGALDVLKLIGTEKDIKSIEEIIKNAPVLDSTQLKRVKNYKNEQIQQKGEHLIEYLQKKEKNTVSNIVMLQTELDIS